MICQLGAGMRVTTLSWQNPLPLRSQEQLHLLQLALQRSTTCHAAVKGYQVVANDMGLQGSAVPSSPAEAQCPMSGCLAADQAPGRCDSAWLLRCVQKQTQKPHVQAAHVPLHLTNAHTTNASTETMMHAVLWPSSWSAYMKTVQATQRQRRQCAASWPHPHHNALRGAKSKSVRSAGTAMHAVHDKEHGAVERKATGMPGQ
jgi:hypothetical protein